jgi:hypothetical protein
MQWLISYCVSSIYIGSLGTIRALPISGTCVSRFNDDADYYDDDLLKAHRR